MIPAKSQPFSWGLQQFDVSIVIYAMPVNEFNSSPPGQNGDNSADDIFIRNFVNAKSYILIRISLKIVPRGPIDNNPALVQIMAWRRTGVKPLSEPMPTQFTDAYMRY